jgi:2-polyprenyl-6-methoxyphenol hydroxylase-like FAD-dependent oxidoreductase
MAATDSDRVIVAGGGPVGFTTALVLARAGIPVTVVEAEERIISSPRAVVYHPPVLEALDQLDLMEDLTRAGVLKQSLEMRELDGTILARIDYRHLEDLTPFPYNLHLGQDRLAGIVLEHLLTSERAAVLWSHRVTAIEQDDAGVTVVCETPAGEARVSGRWLVGADGGRSGVRKALRLPFEGFTHDVRFVATNVVHDFEAEGYGRASFVIHPEHWAVIVKITDGDLWRCTYGEDPALPEETVRQRVEAEYSRYMAPGSAFEIEAVSPYRVHERCAPAFRVGRVLLAGDAAHVCNPCGGFGLTSGLLDAVALGWPLAAVWHGRRDAAILDRYADERRRVFLEKTSPTASENLRRFREHDPERKAQDRERFRQLREDPEFNRTVGSFSFALASRELADPGLVA